MQRAFTSIFFSTLSLATFGYLIPLAADAQVTADGTTSTTVNQAGNDFTIEQGDRVGDNLFHSFDEFSVPTLGSAAFKNAGDITNIFSRVTGRNISNINGELSANGAANLFLINPNGIIFGPTARLNLGGSFLASTADSFLFGENIEFSASNPQAPPLLEVNIPIGLNFRDNPGTIVNRSIFPNSTFTDLVGLEVAPGKNLTLVGGNIDFEIGQATARGGNIQLGGLSKAGTVTFNNDGSLNFPEDVAQADITLSNFADIDVSGAGGGSITINTRNLNLEAGGIGSSFIRAGITVNSTSAEAQAGNITMNATDNITVDDSYIINQVNSGAVGNAGDVTINTGALTFINGGAVSASTFGQGNAGSVQITASDTISIDGEDSQGFSSGVTSQVNPDAVGNAGGVTITASSLSLTNGGIVGASTFGQGNGGSVKITASDTITIDGENSRGSSSRTASAVLSEALGDAGNITIHTDFLFLTNGGKVDASTFGRGNAGLVEIAATDTVIINGEDSGGIPSAVFSSVASGAEGDFGGVNITTGTLTLTNGGRVSASTFGRGNAGLVEIIATDTIVIDGEDLDGFPSGVISQVASEEAEGDGGNISIDTDSLTLTNGGAISASALVGGDNGGLVQITASDIIFSNAALVDVRGTSSGSIIINARNLNLEAGELGTSFIRAGIIANSTSVDAQAGNITINVTDNVTIDDSLIANSVDLEAVGNAGDISINTKSLSLTNGGQVNVSTLGRGNAGAVKITSTDAITIDGQSSRFGGSSGVISAVALEGKGDAKDVIIDTGSLSLTNGGVVSASTLGEGNAGSVKINATDTITIDGEDSDGSSNVSSQVNSEAEGDGGDVSITTGSLFLTNGGIVSTSTLGKGNAGSVKITATDTITIDGTTLFGVPSGVESEVSSGAEGDGGDVIITTGSLSLTNGGVVSASTLGRGNAGFVEITALDTITIDSSSSVISAVVPRAKGDGGDVRITTDSLFLTNGGQVNTSTLGEGNAGSVNITATDTITINGEDSDGSSSGVISSVASEEEVEAGGVTIETGSLFLANEGVVGTSTLGRGNAGLVEITATDTITINGESGVFSQVNRKAVGDAVGVIINTGSLSLTNGGKVSASTFGRGNAGLVKINATDTIMIDGEDSDGIPSGVTSLVNPEAEGDAGGVKITTGSLFLTNGGGVSASTEGEGNAGLVKITAKDTITIDGEDSEGNNNSGVFSGIALGVKGDAGGVTIDTRSLSLTNGGRIDASTEGEGNAGSVEITAKDTITIDGENSDGFPSGASSQVNPEAEGDSEGVTITTGSLSLTNGGRVSASTFGQGNAGSVEINATDTIMIDGENSDGVPSGANSRVLLGAEGDSEGVIITTGSLSLTNGGQVSASTFSQGNAGSVEINASDTITIDGERSNGFPSVAISQVNPGAVGNARGITITTGSLSLTNGGAVDASTLGKGSAGSVEINASDTITIDGERSNGISSNVTSGAAQGAIGNAGGITITTGSLSLTNGGVVNANTFDQGNAGLVKINATDTIFIDGENSDGIFSAAGSQVGTKAEGDAEGVTITARSLSLTNGGRVDASTFGQGNAGPVKINATDTIFIDGEDSGGLPSGTTSQVNPGAVGNAGGVTITTGSLSLTNGGIVSASTVGQGNAGNINVNARESIFISGAIERFRSGISADAFISSGNGGDVNVVTNQLTINDGGSIEAGNIDSLGNPRDPGTGQPGDINIKANSLSLSNQASIEAATQSEIGEAANINLTINEDIILENNSLISATALGNANGGNVTINADDGSIVAFPNQNNDIIANADRGNGGDINITTQAIFGFEERPSIPPNRTNDIDASSQFGLQGNFSLNTPEVDPTSGLIELPEAVVNASDQISQNPCEQGVGSEFIVTGKGGLPPNPNETLNSNRVRVGLVEPVPLQQGGEINEEENSILPENPKPEPVPVQGLIFNNKGQVMLTSYKTPNTEIRQSRQKNPLTCSSGI